MIYFWSRIQYTPHTDINVERLDARLAGNRGSHNLHRLSFLLFDDPLFVDEGSEKLLAAADEHDFLPRNIGLDGSWRA